MHSQEKYPFGLQPASNHILPNIMNKNQHVVPTSSGWGVRGAGNERLTSVHETQSEAFQAAREIAINQQSEVFVHRPNGQIRERNTYGPDPYPPVG